MPRIRPLLAAALVFAAFPLVTAVSDARPGDAQTGSARAPKPMAALDANSVPAEISPTPGAAWRPLAPGAKIPIGATVRSAAKPVQIALGNGGLVELAPESSASLAGSVDLVLGRGGATSVIRLDVRSGEVMATLPASAKRQAVLCGSKDLLAVARPGTELRVRAVPAAKGNPPDLLVGAYAGEASVASIGAWRAVPASHTVMLRADERVPEPLALGAAPAWASEIASDGASLRVVTGAAQTSSFALRWARVEGATGYVAELARDASFAEVITRTEVPASAAPSLATRPLPTGRYFARVRTRGVSGVPGLAGPTRTLRVVRAVLPSGAVAEGDTWILPLGGRVRFDEPTGLELALGQHAFYPATTSFGIGTDSALLARVRIAGERVGIPIRIAPSTLTADIDVSPKTATWPRDPVTIAVRLSDPKRPVPAFEPKITVKVDLEEVPVAWKREGNTWRARIQPRNGHGPWVVRVEATDPNGNELGRGHLEVVGAAR